MCDRVPDADHAGSTRTGRSSTFRLQCFDASIAAISAGGIDENTGLARGGKAVFTDGPFLTETR